MDCNYKIYIYKDGVLCSFWRIAITFMPNKYILNEYYKAVLIY